MKDEKGFTLVELLVAMLILIFSLIALANLIAVALLNNSLARSKSFGVEAAQMAEERLRDLYNQSLVNGTPLPASFFNGNLDVQITDAAVAAGILGAGPASGNTVIIGTDKLVFQKFNRYRVSWTAALDPNTSKSYRADITATPVNSAGLAVKSRFNPPIKVTSYFSP